MTATTAGSEASQSKSKKSQSPVSRLVAPLRGTLILASVLQGTASVAGVVPFIAVAELGRVLLAEGPMDEGRAWLIAFIGVGALATQFVFMLGAATVTHFADVEFQYRLRRDMARRLTAVPLGWFTERNAGAVKKALEEDVSALHHLVGHSYTNMVSAIVTPIAALGYLFWVDWRLALITLIPTLLGIALYGLMNRGYDEKMVAYDQALEDVNSSAVAFVQGIAVIKTFGQARRAYSRFIERAQGFVTYFWEWVRGLIPVTSATMTVLSPLFVLAVVFAAGVPMVAAGLVPAVELLPFVVLGPGLVAPLLTLSYAHNDLMLARKAAERITGLLDTPALSLAANPRKPNGTRVVFEDVSFSYDGQTEAVRNIDLALEPGTVTALVGASGSGKSTLGRLLPRFWDPTEGRIMIGGVPVDEIPSDELYKLVGIVFQDVQLLRASVRENIALSMPDAPMEQVELAARAAQIHDRIAGLERGYDTIVGEEAQLSGGEAQRVSIARAILADTPILVLDEATAFADPEAEATIQDALSELVAGRTLLVIAHRLHTIVRADQICVLDRGQIVERGAHSQLVASDGIYSKLWEASEVSS